MSSSNLPPPCTPSGSSAIASGCAVPGRGRPLASAICSNLLANSTRRHARNSSRVNSSSCTPGEVKVTGAILSNSSLADSANAETAPQARLNSSSVLAMSMCSPPSPRTLPARRRMCHTCWLDNCKPWQSIGSSLSCTAPPCMEPCSQ